MKRTISLSSFLSQNPKFLFSHLKSCFSKKKVISVEGNIGAGKSTYLRILKEELKIPFELVPEPVNQWEKIGNDNKNINLLELFYKDPKKWGYIFQSYCFYSRLKAWTEIKEKCTENKLYIFERSVYSDKYIFGLNSHEAGFINEVEWLIYNDWHDFLVSKLSEKLDGLIYLSTDPKTCFQRKNKRDRTGENNIQLSYLENLHKRHEEWLKSEFKEKIPVLVLDCKAEFETDEKRRKDLVQKTRDFIAELNNSL